MSLKIYYNNRRGMGVRAEGQRAGDKGMRDKSRRVGDEGRGEGMRNEG